MIEVCEPVLHVGRESLAQLRRALGGGVPVLASVDGGLGRGPDRLGNLKVRLADAQVDRVLERLAQLEHLTDAGQFDQPGAVGQPRLGEHCGPRKKSI